MLDKKGRTEFLRDKPVNLLRKNYGRLFAELKWLLSSLIFRSVALGVGKIRGCFHKGRHSMLACYPMLKFVTVTKTYYLCFEVVGGGVYKIFALNLSFDNHCVCKVGGV